MRGFTLLLVGALMLIPTFNSSAQSNRNLKDFKAGKWSVTFNSPEGFTLYYNGVNLIRNSTMIIHNGNYTSAYLSYLKGENRFTSHDIPGGIELVAEHLSDTVKGKQTIDFLENEVRFHFEYEVPKEIHDGKLDYCFGYLSAQPLAGKAYTLKTAKGEKSGIIPVKDWVVNTNYASEYFKEASFDSTLGRIQILTEGDLDGLELLEFRGSAVPLSRRAPVLWSGYFQKKLEGGRKYSQTVTLRIDPAAAADRPSRIPGKAQVSAAPASPVQTSPGGEVLIIPEPKKLSILDGSFPLNTQTRIVVAEDASVKDFSGALQFSSEVFETYGIHLKTVRESNAKNLKNVILVGELARNKMLAEAADKAKLVPPAQDEGYALLVTPDQVLVAGHDPAGSFYGMQTLRQLLRPDSESAVLKCCQVIDWPTLKVRGLLLYTSNDSLPFHKKLIDRIITRYKYNTLLLECSYARWDTDPEMAVDFAISKADLKKDIDYARRNFLEVIPELSTLGHFEWAFKKGRHLDIAEDPEVPYAYCPSKQASYDFVFKIFDEAIDLFQSKYLHIGHDEVTNFGKFPKCLLCSNKSVTDLVSMDLQKMDQYFQKKGVRPMMWGDMLLGPDEARSGNNAPSLEDARKRRESVPHNMIIADWHYFPAPANGYPSLDIFKKMGFDVLACGWDDPRNISAFSQAAKNDKDSGYIQTIWAGRISNEKNLKDQRDQFTALVMAGDYAWNDGKMVAENLPYKTDGVFDQAYNRQKPVFIRRDGFTVDLSSLYNIRLADNPRGTGWIGMGPEFDLKNAPVKQVSLKGIKFQLADSADQNSAIRVASTMDLDGIYPEKVTIPLSLMAKSLFFLQTTTRWDNPDAKSGSYLIHYSDGNQLEIPVIYRKGITAWNDSSATPGAEIVWAADNGAGERVVLRSMEWVNPYPEKKIESIDILSGKTEAGLVLLGLSAVN